MEQENFAEQFERDVSNHKMIVIKDDNLYRHLRFQRVDSRNKYFDIITWPGHLCYTGDMGTYVFSRISDMFDFFRRDKPNLGYWAEKLQAVDKYAGVKKYSPEVFESVVRETIEEFCDEMSDDEKAEIIEEVENELIPCADEGEEQARLAANDFMINGEYVFHDFWECDLTDYDYFFVWCCHAIPWAIAKYDGRPE